MLRIAICDDVPEFLEQAKRHILLWNNGQDTLHIDLFTDADALICRQNAAPYDIIFLDVVMPLLGGIQAAEEIRQQDKTVKIVFLTSSSEFAVDSYRVKASNYLLKPLDKQMLFRCLDELAEEIRQNSKHILIRSRNTARRVALNQIEYVEANNKSVLLVLSNGQTLEVSEPLYALEHHLLLSDGFYKCNRSYIVNIHQIDTYTNKEIKMRSGYRIPISRSCYKDFETVYFTTLFGKVGDL